MKKPFALSLLLFSFIATGCTPKAEEQTENVVQKKNGTLKETVEQVTEEPVKKNEDNTAETSAANNTMNPSDGTVMENTEEVIFAPGTTGTTIKSAITGRQSKNYALKATAGQTMNVVLSSGNTANYFNIFAPGKGPGDEAMFIGSINGNRYTGTLPATGHYIIQVYMMRSAARRNETANYTLKLDITGEKKEMSGNSSIQWPASGDASGRIVCSGKKENIKSFCEFRVKRKPNGATIWMVKPENQNTLRTLYVENNTFTTDDSSKIKQVRVDDNWKVSVGISEIYIIPHALIYGG
ncbi:hypothetical protein [Prosthecochloris sp.]|uniref:hypothetical protein n=1 Tax=Prosthecochloris sp. TaxID=290513 RepID=UPI0025EAC880|nr:hypothetical protein [Prosthecochloris sp.]